MVFALSQVQSDIHRENDEIFLLPMLQQRDSISIATYPLCIYVRDLLVKYTGFQLVINKLQGRWCWHLLGVQSPFRDCNMQGSVLSLFPS